jgi:hypothetical protein
VLILGDYVKLSVYNNEPYAVYVEFGTGTKGSASPKEFVPDGVSLVYRDTGWTYFSEKLNRYVHTNGFEARQFFYPPIFNELPWIEKELKKVVKRFMNND